MEKLNAIYSKTYNFVYLRAKTILEKEEDVQELMKEVYVKAIEEDVREERLFQWMGKKVYALGCGKYRKKKAREADRIELRTEDYGVVSLTDLETTKELICDTLEELPDMYWATVYALYRDHMSIKEIASAMGYSREVIINRINYVHKYLQKVLQNYKEENDIPVQFSVQALEEALRDWSESHCLSEMTAQSIYSNVCRELGVETGEIDFSATDGGTERSAAQNDLRQELEAYQAGMRLTLNPKTLAIGVVAALVVLTIAGILLFGKSDKEDPKDKKPSQGQQDDFKYLDDDADSSDDANDDADADDSAIADSSEYILPNSNTVKLTRADLQGLSLEQLRLARNEIYARHGTIFGPADLQQYFGSKSWYKPTISFQEFNDHGSLNEFEGANLTLIVKMEDELSRNQ